MSDAVHPGRRALDDWRAAQAHKRAAGTAAADGWIGGWTVLLLVAALLYILIGHHPYDHDLVFDPLTGGALMSPVNRYFWLALLGLSVPVLVARRQDLPRFFARLWPLGLLFLWFAASTCWAIDAAASSRRLVSTVIGLVICIAVRLGLPDGRRIHTAFAWTCAIIIAIDLGSWIFLPVQSMTDIGLAAIHSHKNTLGAVMLLSSLVITPYIWTQPTLARRVAWSGVLLASLALLVASRSKTSIALVAVAAVLGPTLFLALRLHARLLWGFAALALAAVIAAGFGWLAWNGMNGTDPFAPLARLSFTGRTDVWRFVAGEIAKRPLTGVGYGSFWDVDPAVQPSLQTDEWFAKPDAPTNEAHNGYLDLMATTGLPGLVGALILLGRWAAGGLQMARRARLSWDPQERAKLPFAMVLAMFPLIFFIHNWMESSYFTPDSAFLLIILLVGVCIDMRDDPGGVSAPRPGAP